MKNIAIILLATLLIPLGAVFGQDCAFYYPKQEGATLEITNYNRKDKVTGRTIQKITNVQESGNSLKATVQMKSYDDKDELIFESEVDVMCKDNEFNLSMENFINGQQMTAFSEADITIDSDNLRYPANMKPGQELNDGVINISVNNAGMPMMNMTTTIDNRKVEGKEKITTPAGTFDCFKISYDITSKMMVSVTMKAVEWISMDAGVVKSESYKSNGKLMGYSLLTNLEK